MALRCPACQSDSLKPEDFSDVEVDVCVQCRGIWFDGRELEQISEIAAKDLHTPADALPSTLLCPRCSQALHLFAYPQTSAAVAMCRQCEGMWVKAENYRSLVLLRMDLRARGDMERYAPMPGMKGALLRNIDAAIAYLMAGLKG